MQVNCKVYNSEWYQDWGLDTRGHEEDKDRKARQAQAKQQANLKRQAPPQIGCFRNRSAPPM
jgi:hypothetical protein